MSRRCYICDNIRDKTYEITLHAFPKDENIRKKWMNACGLISSDDVKNVRICSNHFKPSEFKAAENNEHGRKFLKHNAIPSVRVATAGTRGIAGACGEIQNSDIEIPHSTHSQAVNCKYLFAMFYSGSFSQTLPFL